MTETRTYEVPGPEISIGHGAEAYPVREGRVELPGAPWVNELEQRGVIRLIETDVAIPALLVEAGYTTVAAVQAASDEELLDISGVGKATLRQLRAELG